MNKKTDTSRLHQSLFNQLIVSILKHRFIIKFGFTNIFAQTLLHITKTAQNTYLSSSWLHHKVSGKTRSLSRFIGNQHHILIQWIARNNLPITEHLFHIRTHNKPYKLREGRTTSGHTKFRFKTKRIHDRNKRLKRTERSTCFVFFLHHQHKESNIHVEYNHDDDSINHCKYLECPLISLRSYPSLLQESESPLHKKVHKDEEKHEGKKSTPHVLWLE